MRKRILTIAATLGSTGVGAFILYALAHPATVALSVGAQARISDRVSKCGLQPVEDAEAVLRQVAGLHVL